MGIEVKAVQTCHFRQLGLNDGAPVFAPSANVKMYSLCTSLRRGARTGSSLAGNVMRGTLSKRRFKGAGRAGALLVRGDRASVRLAFDFALSSLSSVLSSDCIVDVHTE